jgi:pseudouridine-5'-phosphate glycosidase
MKEHGATTVSATMAIANMVGIKVGMNHGAVFK